MKCIARWYVGALASAALQFGAAAVEAQDDVKVNAVEPAALPGASFIQEATVTGASKDAGSGFEFQLHLKGPSTPVPSITTQVWTGACSANWDEQCEGDRKATIPSGYEYCSVTWAMTTLNGAAYFEPRRSYAGGFDYHLFARGSHNPFDRWGSSVGVAITLRGITSGTSELVRQRNGCRSSEVFGKDVWACVRTGGNVQAVSTCLRGAGACDRFPELFMMRCTTSMQTIPGEVRQACNGLSGVGRQGTEVYISNSPQCR